MVAAWAFAGLGILMMAIAVVLAAWRARFLIGSSATTGEVVALEDSGEFPVVTFFAATDALAQPRTVRFRAGTNAGSWRVGDKAPVRYRPATPERACIATFRQLWLAAIVLAVMGLAFVAAAYGIATSAAHARPIPGQRSDD